MPLRRLAGVPLLLLACSETAPAGGGAAGPPPPLPMDGEPGAPDDATRDPADGTSEREETSEGPSLPLTVLGLSALPARTTPDAISITLAQNVDQLKLQLNLDDARGFPVSACQAHDIDRIGPNAVSWPMGGTITVPLGYTETLPDGLYTQSVYMLLGAGDYDIPYEVRMAHFFEVHAGGLRPISSREYTDAVTPTTIGPDGKVEIVGAATLPDAELPRDPCPPPTLPTDVIAAAGATSRVDVDSWSRVDTIQPLRWRASVPLHDGSRTTPMLVFHARDAAAGRIRFQLPVPSEAPEPFEAEITGALVIDEPVDVDTLGRPSSAQTSWRGQSGRVGVHIEPDGTLRVELTDVVLSKSRLVTEAEVTRAVSSGSISGAWVLE